MKDNTQSYQENNPTDKDILRDIKANSLSEQETADVLPPLGFPMQKPVPSVIFLPKIYNRQEIQKKLLDRKLEEIYQMKLNDIS